MTDGVDARVHGMKPPALDAVLDLASREVSLGELRPAYHAVLALRESRDLGVDRSRLSFPRISLFNDNRAAHAAEPDGSGVSGGAPA